MNPDDHPDVAAARDVAPGEAGAAVGQRARRARLLSVFIAGFALLLAATGMYLIEGGHQPEAFGSIPRALWWSVTTLTTVGYGDTVPVTALGRLFAALTAIAGVGLIALPAGILAAAFTEASRVPCDSSPER